MVWMCKLGEKLRAGIKWQNTLIIWLRLEFEVDGLGID